MGKLKSNVRPPSIVDINVNVPIICSIDCTRGQNVFKGLSLIGGIGTADTQTPD